MRLRMARFVPICLAASRLVAGAHAGGKNMNGLYSVASGTKQDVPFNTDYASKGHEYFDIWSPEIATHYGEVFWLDMGVLPLPKEIVDRFSGKVMAITGYEHDQVMVEPVGQPGVNPNKDVSVPINWAYNHHYSMNIVGHHGELRKVVATPGMAHGEHSMLIGVDKPSAKLRADPSIPTSQWFSEGNGGESRHSFHGYPKGYAQLVDSPETWNMIPMQIDTRNRDCGATRESITNCTRFVPGPEPKQARWGFRTQKNTNYSGLVECPCTDRFGGDPLIYGNHTKTKYQVQQYQALAIGTCLAGKALSTAQSCFDAAHMLGITGKTFVNMTVLDLSLPPACSLRPFENGTTIVTFNSASSTKECVNASSKRGSITSSVGITLDLKLQNTPVELRFQRSPKGQFCADADKYQIKSFRAQTPTDLHFAASLRECESFCADHSLCWGCTAHCNESSHWSYGFLAQACQFLAVTSCETREAFGGAIQGDISEYNPSIAVGHATLTLSGPSDAWFGVGFQATRMCDLPYAIVVNDTGAQEWKLGTCGDEGCHCAIKPLSDSVKVVSNTVQGNVRTVVLSRPLKGQTADHFSFDMDTLVTLDIVTAFGTSETFAFHASHAAAQLTLEEDGSSICICDGDIVGKLCQADGVNGCFQYQKTCLPFDPIGKDSGDLSAQQNPTCNSKTYVGGLTSCCQHGRILLDQDQEVRPELLRYHVKFRIWFEEYTSASAGSHPSHYNLNREYYLTERDAGEYDVPPAFQGHTQLIGYTGLKAGERTPGTVSCTGACPDGLDCECVHEIKSTWTLDHPMRLLYAGGHCHAPMCLSLELYYIEDGKPVLLCSAIPKHGQGNVTGDRFDEAGYILIPPCLWGSKEEGLEPSVLLPAGTKMMSIARDRNSPSVGHYGEMASWQMRAVDFPEDEFLI